MKSLLSKAPRELADASRCSLGMEKKKAFPDPTVLYGPFPTSVSILLRRVKSVERGVQLFLPGLHLLSATTSLPAHRLVKSEDLAFGVVLPTPQAQMRSIIIGISFLSLQSKSMLPGNQLVSDVPKLLINTVPFREASFASQFQNPVSDDFLAAG
ncbi:hypothetical protein STEG23_005275 [Scotinomys teguina]